MRDKNIISWITYWLSSYIFLYFYVMEVDDQRSTIPYGQYIFFTICLIIVVGYFKSFSYKNILTELAKYKLYYIFFMVYLVGAIFSEDMYVSQRLVAILVITSFPAVLIGSKLGGDLDSVVVAGLMFGFVCSVGAMLLSIVGPLSMGSFVLKNYLHASRWSFLFEEANGFAVLIVFSITSALYLLVSNIKVFNKLLLVAVVLPILLFVFTKTSSRSSFAWLFISVSMFFGYYLTISYYRKKISKNTILFVMVGIVFLFLFIGVVYINEFVDYLRIKSVDGFTTRRYMVWQQVWQKYIESNILLGYGLGVTGGFVEGPQVHSPLNVYIGMLGETGAMGLLVLVVPWLLAIRYLVSTIIFKVKNVEDAGKYVWLCSILVGLLIQQNGEWNIMKVSPLNYLYFFVLAYSFSEYRLRKTGKNK